MVAPDGASGLLEILTESMCYIGYGHAMPSGQSAPSVC